MEFENMRSLVSRMILETQAALEKAEFDVQTVLSHMDLETLWDSPEIDLGGEVIDLFVAMDPNSHRRVVEGTFRVGSNVHAMSDPLIQELIRKALEGEIEASSLVQPISDSTSP